MGSHYTTHQPYRLMKLIEEKLNNNQNRYKLTTPSLASSPLLQPDTKKTAPPSFSYGCRALPCYCHPQNFYTTCLYKTFPRSNSRKTCWRSLFRMRIQVLLKSRFQPTSVPSYSRKRRSLQYHNHHYRPCCHHEPSQPYILKFRPCLHNTSSLPVHIRCGFLRVATPSNTSRHRLHQWSPRHNSHWLWKHTHHYSTKNRLSHQNKTPPSTHFLSWSTPVKIWNLWVFPHYTPWSQQNHIYSTSIFTSCGWIWYNISDEFSRLQ